MNENNVPKAVLTDAEYVLGIIDETFVSVPQIKAHHDRLRSIASKLAAAPVAQPPASEEDVQNILNSWLDNQHPDDAAVDAFASKMRQKMTAARAKGRSGWSDKVRCSAETLSRMLRDHVEKGDPVDVANFCMMLAQRGESIATQPPAPVQQTEAVAKIENGRLVWTKVPLGVDCLLYATPPAPATALPPVAKVRLSDDQIWASWIRRPEIPDGEDDSMERQIVAFGRAIIEASTGEQSHG